MNVYINACLTLNVHIGPTAIITESVKMYNYIANIGRYLPESKCLII